ncbi:MAG: Peptidase domain protein [Parcubacteria group bacterium]|nr:Peptidase domain protein [Parcubacteria group bacterium]
MWDPYADFESATLSNGLDVHVLHWPDRPWVSGGLIVHSGARHDPVGLEGSAHFVEHLVSRNTPVPYLEIRKFFESTGGGVRLGATNYHATKYHFFVPTHDAILRQALDIFGAIFAERPIENFVEIQREVILGEYQRRNPVKVLADLQGKFNQVLYGAHWLGRYLSPMGSPESICRIAQSDLQLFHDEHYAARNMSMVFVGGLSLEKAVDLLEKSPLGRIRSGDRQPLLSPLEAYPAPSESRHVFEFSKHIVTNAAREVASYGSACVIPAGSVKDFSVYIMSEMLNRILFDEVRETRGWAYEIRAERSYHQDVIDFSVFSSALVLKAVDSIEEVITKSVALVGSSEDLFEKTLNQSLASYDMSDLNGTAIRGSALKDLEKEQKVVTCKESRDSLRKLTMEDVRSALKWLSPERRFTLLKVP